LKLAVKQHQETNPHHLEFWGNIEKCPKFMLLSLCVTQKQDRLNSEQISVDGYEQMHLKKYGFKVNGKVNGKVYKKVMKYVNRITTKPFKKLK
jgi:hypothetical protein